MLYRLDHTVVCPADGTEAGGEVTDGLMVDRVDLEVGSGNDRCETALVDQVARADGHGTPCRLVLWVGGADVGRDIYEEGAPERDIQYLEPAAYREGGQAFRGGGRREFDFELVPIEVDSIDGVLRPAPIARGVDIATSAQDEPVDAIEQVREVLVRHRRQENRHSTCSQHAVRVRALQDVRVADACRRWTSLGRVVTPITGGMAEIVLTLSRGGSRIAACVAARGPRTYMLFAAALAAAGRVTVAI